MTNNFFHNSQQIKKLKKFYRDKNIGTDYIPVDCHSLKRNHNMNIIINELNLSLDRKDKSKETINDIVVKQPIKKFDATNLS